MTFEVSNVDTRNGANGRGEARINIRSRKDPTLDLKRENDAFNASAYEDGTWHQPDCTGIGLRS